MSSTHWKAFRACLVPIVTNVLGIPGSYFYQSSTLTWSQMWPTFQAYLVRFIINVPAIPGPFITDVSCIPSTVIDGSFKSEEKKYKAYSGRYVYRGKLNGKPYYRKNTSSERCECSPSCQFANRGYHLVYCGDNFWGIIDGLDRLLGPEPDQYDSKTIGFNMDVYVKSQGASTFLSK